jgi:membrane protease YdiL (CAAX protease family)
VKRDGLALAFAMAFPSVMTWMEFMVLPGEGAEGSPALLAVFVAGKIVQFTFPLAFVWWFERDRIRLAAPTSRGLELGIAFGLVVGVGALVLYFAWLGRSSFMAGTPAEVSAWLTKARVNTPAGFLGMAVFISVFHSLLEEYYWRWFVFGWLKRYLRVGLAMVVSSLAFMAHHVIVLTVYTPGQFWTMVVPFSLCVAGGGIVWAWLYERTQSLYAPWISHLLVDAALMVLGYDMVSPYWMK